jgi:hypothetical protein
MASMTWVRNIVEWPLRRRQLALMTARQSYSKSDFLGFFVARGIAPEIADGVWNILVDNAVVEGFKPRPEDDLAKVFGLAEEDLDEDVVLELLQRFGFRIPGPVEVESMAPVNTATDLVEFIWQMKQPASAR